MTPEVRKALASLLAGYLEQSREIIAMLYDGDGLLDNVADGIGSAQGYVATYRRRLEGDEV